MRACATSVAPTAACCVLGRHFPAMTLVQVVALVEGRAKVEIEATAVVSAG